MPRQGHNSHKLKYYLLAGVDLLISFFSSSFIFFSYILLSYFQVCQNSPRYGDYTELSFNLRAKQSLTAVISRSSAKTASII